MTTSNSPVPNKSQTVKSKVHRILGIVMTVIAIAGFGWLAFAYKWEQTKTEDFPSAVGPYTTYTGIYHYAEGQHLFSVLFSATVIVLILGICRIITNAKPAKALTAATFVIVFSLFTVQEIQSVRHQEDTRKELLEAQRTLAEQRYGIEYDEITVRTWEVRKGQLKHMQDDVMKNGQIIAAVCPQDRYNIRFCEPGTNNELPVSLDGKDSPPT